MIRWLIVSGSCWLRFRRKYAAGGPCLLYDVVLEGLKDRGGEVVRTATPWTALVVQITIKELHETEGVFSHDPPTHGPATADSKDAVGAVDAYAAIELKTKSSKCKAHACFPSYFRRGVTSFARKPYHV